MNTKKSDSKGGSGDSKTKSTSYRSKEAEMNTKQCDSKGGSGSGGGLWNKFKSFLFGWL